jgi:hypothetical protein
VAQSGGSSWSCPIVGQTVGPEIPNDEKKCPGDATVPPGMLLVFRCEVRDEYLVILWPRGLVRRKRGDLICVRHPSQQKENKRRRRKKPRTASVGRLPCIAICKRMEREVIRMYIRIPGDWGPLQMRTDAPVPERTERATERAETLPKLFFCFWKATSCIEYVTCH